MSTNPLEIWYSQPVRGVSVAMVIGEVGIQNGTF